MEIILRDIKLMGYHGVTELERKAGTDFCIDIVIKMNEHSENGISQLSDTIDYSSVYSLLSNEFAIPEQLLETLAVRIVNKILSAFSTAQQVELTILKVNAPIAGLDGKVGIKFKKSR
ncbi:MAG: dihydroneopterin aldolase [bacterium]|jgi:dihydroneopterin aldolase